MEYKIVIFDIGKTLFDKNNSLRASDQVLFDIEALRKKGMIVGVCTMRTIKHCQKVVPTELDFYISLNGSYVTCGRERIVDNPMIIPADSTDFLSYGTASTYYSTEKAKSNADRIGFLSDKKGVARPAYNAVLFDIPPEKLCLYEAYTTEYWIHTGALSLQNKSTSRVFGIREVLHFYDIKTPILYFGDGPNDLEIFQTYQDCVCMGDCYPELNRYALFQTKACKDEGVSFALRKMNLLP